MSTDSKHFQAQSVTLLVTATGVLGFGLLGADFRVSMEFLPTAKFVGAGYVLAAYVVLVRSVRGILEKDNVTGKDVVQGPLTYLFLVVNLRRIQSSRSAYSTIRQTIRYLDREARRQPRGMARLHR